MAALIGILLKTDDVLRALLQRSQVWYWPGIKISQGCADCSRVLTALLVRSDLRCQNED